MSSALLHHATLYGINRSNTKCRIDTCDLSAVRVLRITVEAKRPSNGDVSVEEEDWMVEG